MNSQEYSVPKYASLFGDFQFGSNTRSQAYESVPKSPFTEHPVLTTQNPLTYNNVTLSPPVDELAAVSLESPKKPKCLQCKGKRFEFTSYFHNAQLFRSPPHELLALIERSYVLKDRLQSLLVTYIMNDLRGETRMPDIRKDILDWVQQVSNLCDHVREGMEQAEGASAGLDVVETWTEKTARRLESHLETSNGVKMIVQKGWMKSVLCEFRKNWEIIWVAFARSCDYQQEMSLGPSESHRGMSDGPGYIACQSWAPSAQS